MFGIEFIEVGIGLFFAFFALSTICSTIVEIFSKIRKLRSKHLRSTLGDLLGEKEYNGIVDELYDHHLISSSVKKKVGETTYIDAKDFSSAVLDLLGGYADTSLYNAYLGRVNKFPVGTVKTDMLAILNASASQVKTMEADAQHYFQDTQFSQACVQLIRSFPDESSTHKAIVARIGELDNEKVRNELTLILTSTVSGLAGLAAQLKTWFADKDFCEGMFSLLTFGSKEVVQFKALEARINLIEDPKIKERLLGILNGGAEKLENIKSGLENWFNKSMNDLSEWYKRRMRYFVGGVAVIVVFSLNADSVRLVNELWNDNEMRAATVQATEKFVANEQAVNLAMGNDSAKSLSAMVDTLKHQIDNVHSLPLGWRSQKIMWFKDGVENKEVIYWWLSKLLGLFISIGAVSLGSTYWYRQLKSLLNLRFNLGGNSKSSGGDSKAKSS